MSDREQRIKFFQDRFKIAEKNQRAHVKNWRKYEEIYLGTQEFKKSGSLLHSDLKIKWAYQRWNAIAPELMDPEPKLDFRPVEISDVKLSDALKKVVKLNKKEISLDDFNKMMGE